MRDVGRTARIACHRPLTSSSRDQAERRIDNEVAETGRREDDLMFSIIMNAANQETFV